MPSKAEKEESLRRAEEEIDQRVNERTASLSKACAVLQGVITSYSIHYTKLYDDVVLAINSVRLFVKKVV